VIVTEFFDVDKSRSVPWQRRPMATLITVGPGNQALPATLI
jgi:hypothetical protein